MSDPLRRYLKYELDKLNLHLPKKCRSLSDLINDPSPSVFTRNGTVHSFIKEELHKLSSLLPSFLWPQLLLPIQIIRRRDLGEGHFIVAGSKVQFYTCLLLLGLETRSYEDYVNSDKLIKTTITRLEVQIIRRELSSCSTIGLA